MKDIIQDMAHQLFFEICDKKPIDIDTFFLDQLNFPRIDYEPRMTVYIPMPRQVQGIQALQGCAFIEDIEAYKTLFALYFASVCHAAGHPQVTNFNTYKKWIEGRNKKRALETMEFIEDIRVDKFLKNNFPEYYFEIKKIEEYFKIIYEKKEIEDKEKRTKKVFTEKFVSDIKIEREKIKQDILCLSLDNKEKFIEIANKIYDSSNILSDDKLPFADHFAHPKRIERWIENPKISVEGRFFDIVDRFGEVWIDQLKRRAKVKKKYGGITEDLEFDKIDFAPENIGEYLRLKNATHLFLKRL